MKASSIPTSSSRPVILVTGCGSGIGLELAKLLYESPRYRTIVTARTHRLANLREKFPETDGFKIRPLDITDDGNIYHLVHEVCREWGRIDVVVNNAAVCFRGVVEHMDSSTEMAQLQTNFLGPMSLTRAVLPIMREQRSGQIINISSASGILAMPTMGSYSASKHALEGASEALWYEARPFGIRVNLVELGFVKSDSFRNVVLSNKARMSVDLGGPHSEYYGSMTPFVERLMGLSFTSSTMVAKKILRVIKKRPDRLKILATPDVLIFDLMRRLMPPTLFYKFLYMILPGSVKWGGHWRENRSPPWRRPLRILNFEHPVSRLPEILPRRGS